MKQSNKNIALLGMLTTLALALSFLEAILPPISVYAPGIKIGLPNIIIIFVLYRTNFKSAALVSLLRILITALLFGTAISFLYSLVGAALSLTLMSLLKKHQIFSLTVISISGAVSHNIAQTLLATLLLGTRQLVYYLPVLCLSGLLSGLLVGLLSVAFLKATRNIKI